MSTLEIPKELYGDHRTIKKTDENIIYLRTRSKRKGFKNPLPRNGRKLKQVTAKQSYLTSNKIFEKTEIEGFKDKKCRILS